MDVLGEPFDICNALVNPRFVFYALFGYYWISHEDMATVFYKPLLTDDDQRGMKKTCLIPLLLRNNI